MPTNQSFYGSSKVKGVKFAGRNFYEFSEVEGVIFEDCRFYGDSKIKEVENVKNILGFFL